MKGEQIDYCKELAIVKSQYRDALHKIKEQDEIIEYLQEEKDAKPIIQDIFLPEGECESRCFEVGSIIKHFKRETVDISKDPMQYPYEIIAFGFHSETDEPMVVYKALYSNEKIKAGHICIRPYGMFISEVDHQKYPEIRHKYRFEPL